MCVNLFPEINSHSSCYSIEIGHPVFDRIELALYHI